MKTKLLFGLLIVATLQFSNAQVGHTIGIVGAFNSWTPPDISMTTTDNVHYTKIGWTLSADGQIKFRQDETWTSPALAWGAPTSGSAWPSGIGSTQAGGANIPAIAGTWDVTFNESTGAYSFTQSTLAVDQFTKNIKFYYVNNALKIIGYQGKISIKAYDIIGRLLYHKKDISVQNGFSKSIRLPKNQVSILLIKGDNFTKSLKVIAHQ